MAQRQRRAWYDEARPLRQIEAVERIACRAPGPRGGDQAREQRPRLPRQGDNCRGILTGGRTEIAQYIAAHDFDLALAEYDAWSRRDDASYWLPLAWAEGRRV